MVFYILFLLFMYVCGIIAAVEMDNWMMVSVLTIIPIGIIIYIIITIYRSSYSYSDIKAEQFERKAFIDKFINKCNGEIEREINKAKNISFNKMPYPLYFTKNYLIAKVSAWETRAIPLQRIVWAYHKSKGDMIERNWLILKLDTRERIKIRIYAIPHPQQSPSIEKQSRYLTIAQHLLNRKGILPIIDEFSTRTPWVSTCTRPSTKRNMRWHFAKEVEKKNQQYEQHSNNKYRDIY